MEAAGEASGTCGALDTMWSSEMDGGIGFKLIICVSTSIPLQNIEKNGHVVVKLSRPRLHEKCAPPNTRVHVIQ